MAYRRTKAVLYWIILSGICNCMLYSCGDNKQGIPDTYYVELVNFNDSLKGVVSSGISGKAVFMKQGRIEVLSTNFITEKIPDMRYLKLFSVDGPKEQGDYKITVQIDGSYSIDSIRYFMKKYRYTDKQWVKISDIGAVKGFSSYKHARAFALKDYGDQIVKNIAAYTYN